MIRKIIVAVFLLFMVVLAQAAGNERPLPMDEAFSFETNFLGPNQIAVNWQIAPGYYLYRDKVKVTFTPALAKPIDYPQGEYQFDPDKGRYEAYSGKITLLATLPSDTANLAMKVHYQGCSKGGFCYPPTDKEFNVNTQTKTILPAQTLDYVAPPKADMSLSALVSNQNGVQRVFDRVNLGWMLLIFVGIGLMLSLTPCVLPMVPILMSIIVGQSQPVSTKKALSLSLAYVFGMALTYAAAGMLVAYVGGSLQVWLQTPFVIVLTSALFALLALSMFGLFELRLPSKLQNRLAALSQGQQGGSVAGVFVMGVLATLIVSPCVTAPLVGVLMYISQTGNVVLGGSALFAMGVGMGIPLIVIGTSAGKWLPKSGAWMELVKRFFGVLMLLMAAWLFSRIAPKVLVNALIFALLGGVSAYCLFFLPAEMLSKGYSRSVGAIVLIGALFFGGHAIRQMMRPSTSWDAGEQFVVVNNVSELNAEIAKAQLAKLPILLDFYADWCESCLVMDEQVFDTNTVQQALEGFVLIRADLTANTKEEQKLMQQYNVIAPPTVLFFNSGGKEIASKRIVGDVSHEEFMARLQRFVKDRCDQNTMC